MDSSPEQPGVGPLDAPYTRAAPFVGGGSRTGLVGPLGTLTEELKTKVDEATFAEFRRICAGNGTDAAGALRNYVCKVVHGRTYDEMFLEAAQRRRLLLMPEGLIGAPTNSAGA